MANAAPRRINDAAHSGRAQAVEQLGISTANTQGSEHRNNLGNLPQISSDAHAPDYSANDAVRDLQAIVIQFPIDEIAEDSGSTPRAVEAVRAGENAMQFWKVVRMCRRNPRVRAQVMALLGCEGETDPDFVQGVSLLFNSLARRGVIATQ